MKHDESGATAIEYGLIAGLIALGILGSLVGTRGSLTDVFSQTASQMGSSTTLPATKLATSSIPQSSVWSNKTLVNGSPTTIAQGKKYTFTDGSSVTSTYDPNVKRTYLNVSDPNTLTRSQNVISDDGSYVYNVVSTYYDTAMTQLNDQYITRVSTPQNNAPPIYNQIDFLHYNIDGSRAYGSTVSPTTAQSNTMNSLYYYNKYFSSIK